MCKVKHYCIEGKSSYDAVDCGLFFNQIILTNSMEMLFILGLFQKNKCAPSQDMA